MRVLTIESPGTLKWQEARDPRISSGADALVRPRVIGRCDLDVAFVRGKLPIPPGSVLGHECIADVIDVGADVKTIQPGTRVLVPAQISCGLCAFCRAGHTGRCQSVPFAASFGMGRAGDFGGALADLVRVPYADAMLVPWPETLDPVANIGVADMALDAWRAVGRPLQARPGAPVLVVGGDAAVISMYAVGAALALGASQVVYWDQNAERCEVVRAMGAQVQDPNIDQQGPFGVVVDGGGSIDTLHRALRMAEPEAIFTSVTIYLEPLTPLPLREMYYKGITYITGRPNVRPQMEHVIGLCRSHRFRPNEIPNSVYPFERADEAWLSEELRTVVTNL